MRHRDNTLEMLQEEFTESLKDITKSASTIDSRVSKILDETVGPVVADGGGLRYNEGKLRLDLLPVEWIWALGDVMTAGSKKYAVRNWERGMAWSTVVGCALRHTFKFIAGERYDKETGCHHLAMAAWNILVLMVYDLRGIGEMDLVQVGIDMLEKVRGAPDD